MLAHKRNCLRFKWLSSIFSSLRICLSASHCAQFEALDFARGGFRQVRHELDPAWIFVRREPAFHVLLQRGGELRGLRYIGAPHDEGFWFYQPLILGLTPPCRFP